MNDVSEENRFSTREEEVLLAFDNQANAQAPSIPRPLWLSGQDQRAVALLQRLVAFGLRRRPAAGVPSSVRPTGFPASDHVQPGNTLLEDLCCTI
jgi:hypothetical protein